MINEVPIINTTAQRFRGAEWFTALQRIYKISIVGCGGIGSNLAYDISRLQVPLIDLIDDDTIDASNISGQMFTTETIGKAKVDSLSILLNKLGSNSTIVAHKRRFNQTDSSSNIVLCGLDSMQSRNEVYSIWKNANNRDPESLYIDGRLSADAFQIFAITGDNSSLMDRYEKNELFDDSMADTTNCSFKQTTYMASLIAGYMTSIVVNFISNTYTNSVKYMPYKIEFDSNTFEIIIK